MRELRDQLLRTAAEMENLRKRTEREVNDTRSYAIAGFARDMLTATDNLLTRADGAAGRSARKRRRHAQIADRRHRDDRARNAAAACRSTASSRSRPRAKSSIRTGTRRCSRCPTRTPEGTVVQVVQAGFAIGDRVLRPAMVGVAKGGPKRCARHPSRHRGGR